MFKKKNTNAERPTSAEEVQDVSEESRVAVNEDLALLVTANVVPAAEHCLQHRALREW